MTGAGRENAMANSYGNGRANGRARQAASGWILRRAAPVLALLIPVAGHAADGNVRVELNKLVPQDNACQAYILVENGSAKSFSTLTLDLVMFDPDGIISKRLAVDLAPLRAGKTSVKVFGIDAIACDGLSRILVNEILSCEADGAAQSACLDMIETSARGSVELIN
ncbi:hypothetical protein KHP62_14835 [Rhodobacteraceae bacterium NNCM2]|nr:hypothetical protein [Coraliihabitans acroporae]